MSRPTLLAITACTLSAAVSSASADLTDPNSALIFDWHVRNEFLPGLDVIPMPHPVADFPAGAPVYLSLYMQLLGSNTPIGMMLRAESVPVSGTVDPFALFLTMTLIVKLDYVFADFETPLHDADVLAMVEQVKSFDDPLINTANLGSYHDYPGPYDDSYPYPLQADRTVASEFYLSSGLDVAMPDLYPYAWLDTHTDAGLWNGYVCPNTRAALFWGPLQRGSVTMQNLPAGHRAIGWMAPFVPWFEFEYVEAPPVEDNLALIQHLRLRGVDGYLILESFTPGYPTEVYREQMNAAWHTLDFLFEQEAPPVVLNVETDKLSGVQWSGMTTGDVSAFMISNLGDAPASVDFPELPGVPAQSPVVAPGDHLLLVLQAGNPDLDGDGAVDAADLGVLLGTWGPCGVCPADLNGDGMVDAADLGIVLGSWSAG